MQKNLHNSCIQSERKCFRCDAELVIQLPPSGMRSASTAQDLEGTW